MKPVDVTDNTYIDSLELPRSDDKDPKFKIGDHVKISEYKNFFAKVYTSNWSEEVSEIKKGKNTVPWTYIINDINDDKIIRSFYEKKLQKTNQQEFRLGKVI